MVPACRPLAQRQYRSSVKVAMSVRYEVVDIKGYVKISVQVVKVSDASIQPVAGGSGLTSGVASKALAALAWNSVAVMATPDGDAAADSEALAVVTGTAEVVTGTEASCRGRTCTGDAKV